MNILCFIIILTATTASAGTVDPFSSPVSAFSDALVPILTSFEHTKVQTTWRGFFARGDALEPFSQSDQTPSEAGFYLDVEVRDAEEAKQFSDHTEQEGSLTHRVVRMSPPSQGPQSLLIDLRYGRHVSPDTIRAIDACIARIAAFAKSGAGSAPSCLADLPSLKSVSMRMTEAAFLDLLNSQGLTYTHQVKDGETTYIVEVRKDAIIYFGFHEGCCMSVKRSNGVTF